MNSNEENIILKYLQSLPKNYIPCKEIGITMNNKELTLTEYINQLPETHSARKQYAELQKQLTGSEAVFGFCAWLTTI